MSDVPSPIRGPGGRFESRDPLKKQKPHVRTQGAPTIARYIQEATGDGKELVDLLLGIIRTPKGAQREKITAAKELLDRGFGKAVDLNATLHMSPNSAMHSEMQALALETVRALAAHKPLVSTSDLALASNAEVLDASVSQGEELAVIVEQDQDVKDP